MAKKLKKLILILGDILVLYASLYFALLLRYKESFNYELWQMHLAPFTFIYLIWIFVFYLAGLYDPKVTKNNFKFYSILSKAVVISVLISAVVFYLATFLSITPKTILALDALIFLILFAAWRQVYNNFIKSPALSKKITFLGNSKEIQELKSIINSNPQLGYNIAEFYGELKDLPFFIEKEGVDIIVHQSNANLNEQELTDILYSLLPFGITAYDLPKFYSEITRKIPVSSIGRTWFLENLLENEKGLYEHAKRILDIVFALVLGVVSLPFFPFIALAIRLESKGPAFYWQKRIGKNEKIFDLLKFRTMVKDAEKNGAQWTKTEDKRITKVGSLLRKTRIDELPQLYNVLRGDLSFIGPRPERPEFVKTLKEKIPHYQMRHLVRPGLTGWAQINQPFGTASIKDSTEKLQYDLYYIKNRSLTLDLHILAKTIMIVLKREGR